MRRKSLTKDERKIQIIHLFANRVQEDNWGSASLAQIAGWTGLSPSSHLRKICEALVDDRMLVPVLLKRSGRWDGRGYRPNRKAFRKPKRTTVINFTQNGQKVRLEMLL